MTDLIPTTSSMSNAIDLIRIAHPQSSTIPAEVISAAALLALQCGANPNPLSGELYIYPIAGKWTPYLGIAFYRRLASASGARVLFASSLFPNSEPRLMSQEERAEYLVPDGVLASITRGLRGDHLIEFTREGINWKDAAAMLVRVGVGFLRPDEMQTKDGRHYPAPTGRSWQWKCDKRAEMDLYRKLGLVSELILAAERDAEAAAKAAAERQASIAETIESEPWTPAEFNDSVFG